ncbi:hypothetical protein LTR56_013664 [Elasticomyces elasticus]|nr:hypothetical protein LTR56_013664 [Elasticomyces elasticus]KAK3668513.1 hypothetical protein LTR22_000807 [Elasticomyces elasticus]KAK4930798.1 hypothetical protein LTR49_002562 [Elasticomyces elasticus]KAK5748255.1 hypothetical protein LTS12_021718 [Elasticomyces elasticus]
MAAPRPNLRPRTLPTTIWSAHYTPPPSAPPFSLGSAATQQQGLERKRDVATPTRLSTPFTPDERFRLAVSVINHGVSAAELEKALPGRTNKTIKAHMRLPSWKLYYEDLCERGMRPDE